jgi:hypothetical protein
MIPACSTEENSHLHITSTFAGRVQYDVYKLIHLTTHLPVTSIEVSKLICQLESKCWSTDESYDLFSPNFLYEGYLIYRSWEDFQKLNRSLTTHILKVKNANYNFPLLMFEHQIIDGMHRLLKAYIDKVTVLPVRILQELPPEAIYKEKLEPVYFL